MTSEAEALNAILQAEAPLVFECLSSLGRKAAFPKGIPYQSSTARGTHYNATIGQVTDGHGAPLPVQEMATAVSQLDETITFLYSPQSGRPELRQLWSERQRGHLIDQSLKSSLPLVTHGLTHGVSLVAEMFVDADTPVLVPCPYWENYDLLFGLRIGATLTPFEAFSPSGLDIGAFRKALNSVRGQKALIVLNFPQNPTGYTPTVQEAQELVDVLVAHDSPLVVLCDDAYAGMLYEDGLKQTSLFWDLLGTLDHTSTLLPIKVDGVTKELLFYSGRIGFITHGYTGRVEEALESKIKCLGRGSAGSPTGPSQAMTIRALKEPELESSIAERLAILRRRYEILCACLEQVDDARIQPFPFNSGSFALLGIDRSIPSELLRQTLLTKDTGVISVPSVNAVRIAYCSMSEDAIPQLVKNIAEAIAEF